MPINKITDSNADATHGVDSIGKIARVMADRNGYGGKHRGGLKSIPLYDKGGDVAVEAGRKAQSEGDARIQSLLSEPTAAPLIESQAPTAPAKQTAGAAKLGSTIQQLRNNKYETNITDAKAPTYMPGGDPDNSADAAPAMSTIKVPTSMPVFDEGGDVNVNDGQHQVAILQDGEKVLDPEEAERYRQAQGQTEPTPTKETAMIPTQRTDTTAPNRVAGTEQEPTLPQLGQPKGTPQERQAIAVDKQKAMGQGVDGLKDLGLALIHEDKLSAPTGLNQGNPQERPAAPSAQPSAPGLKPIALPSDKTATTTSANAPLIPSVTAPAPMDHKARLAQYDQRIQSALDEGTPEGQEKADRLQLAKQQYVKSTPWGSADNRPGILGKLGHISEMIGARLPVIGQAMRSIPGTEANRALQNQATLGRINLDTENTLKGAETAEKNAQTKGLANPPEKPAEYEIKTDDQGRMWRVDKLSKQQPQLISFNEQGQPTLSASAESPTFGKKTEKGKEAPANETQIGEYTSQLSVIAPALSAGERETFAFPKGYTPTLAEIQENKSAAHAANEAKLAGKREDLANQTAKATLNKRTQEEKLVEQVAKDIAPMDINSLSQLKNITSMRSDQRSLIYARAKELNPDFNTAEVDRKVKMLDNFTNGKDGQQLQSFGTFLEHSGDANQVVQNIRNGVTPQILNVPLNALEKHGWGTTATQLSAALEPVRKEFEGFLLGGRALYAEDRKAAEAILSDSSTPAQIQAALKQMAHTVSARYNEMDNRFKNTMKVGISKGIGPLSEAAYNGAETIGVKELGGKTLRNGNHGYGWYNTSTEEK